MRWIYLWIVLGTGKLYTELANENLPILPRFLTNEILLYSMLLTPFFIWKPNVHCMLLSHSQFLSTCGTVCNVSYWHACHVLTCFVCHRSLSKTVDYHPHYAQGCWHAIITSVGNHPPHVCCLHVGIIQHLLVVWYSLTRSNSAVASANLRQAENVQW